MLLQQLISVLPFLGLRILLHSFFFLLPDYILILHWFSVFAHLSSYPSSPSPPPQFNRICCTRTLRSGTVRQFCCWHLQHWYYSSLLPHHPYQWRCLFCFPAFYRFLETLLGRFCLYNRYLPHSFQRCPCSYQSHHTRSTLPQSVSLWEMFSSWSHRNY